MYLVVCFFLHAVVYQNDAYQLLSVLSHVIKKCHIVTLHRYYNVICFSDCRQLKKAHVIKFQDLYVTTVHDNFVTQHTSPYFIHLFMLYVPCVTSYKNKGFLSRGVDTGNHGIEIFQPSNRGKALHSLHIGLFLNNLISNWVQTLFCS